jgi:hypothetical protein
LEQMRQSVTREEIEATIAILGGGT